MAFFLRYYNTITVDDAYFKLNQFRYNSEFKKIFKKIYGIDIRCRINRSEKLIVGDIAIKKKFTIVKTELNKGLISNNEDSVSFYEEKIEYSERSYFGISFRKEKLIFLNSKENGNNIKRILSKIIFDNFEEIDNLRFSSEKIINSFKNKEKDILKIWSLSSRKETKKNKEYTYKVSTPERLIEIIGGMDKNEIIDGVGIYIKFLEKNTSLSVYDNGSLNLHTNVIKGIKDKKEKEGSKYLLSLDYNNLFGFFSMLYKLFERLERYTILSKNGKDTKNYKSKTIQDFLETNHTEIFFNINEEYESYFDKKNLIKQIKCAKNELLKLINKKEEKERKYQDFFKKYPYCFSLYYEKIESHNKLDDKNIPDFTGIRTKDKFHDIFEIKQPFKNYLNKNNTPNLEYMKDLEQCKDYLKYCENHKQTLREEKNIHIQEPKCFFITTYNLDNFHKNKLKEKYKTDALKIELITYDEIINQINKIIELLEK